MVKNLPAHTGATGDTGSVAGLGGCPGGGTSNSLQYYSLGNSVESQLGRLQSMRWQEWVSTIQVFDGWSCVPVSLVVWPEISSTGVCRQLGEAGSWYWDVELQETSLWLICPGVWGCLLVQPFGLHDATARAQTQPLAYDPRSAGCVMKQKQEKKNGEQ